MTTTSTESWLKRKARIRKKVFGSPERPRLTVYKSLKHTYAQVIDDFSGETLASASDLDKSLREALKGQKFKKTEVASKVGALLAQRCLEKQIKSVVFDRNGYPYHGRVSAIADAARKAGLEF
ncbi:MAG: 50S ribosomal protein L18 [Myxococcales bacterium]|jgi:large subunit ribosomal protein L18|nr:50S ribosomal protein L18 [Myxococcales bacterium]